MEYRVEVLMTEYVSEEGGRRVHDDPVTAAAAEEEALLSRVASEAKPLFFICRNEDGERR